MELVFNVISEDIINCSIWPDVPISKDKTEFEIFSNYFDATNKSRVRNFMFKDDGFIRDCKNIHKANRVRNVGNQFYKNRDYKNALNCYYNSIILAPRDSVEFGLALGNRSAVLFCLEKYEECLQDINNILKTEYPKDLYYKIYLRQSQCYIKLNKIEKATQSLQMAKECRDNMKIEDQIKLSSINNKITEMENQLGATLNEHVPNELYDYTFLEFKLKDEENPKFLNASKAVDLKYNNEKGRYVVANSDISKGDVLIKEEPYAFAAVVEPIHIIDKCQITNFFGNKDYIQICAICLRRTLSYMPCPACCKHFYCSSTCEKSDQDHRWECEGLKLNILTVQQTICLAILSQASRDGFKTKIEDDSVYGNRMNNHPYVNQLLTQKNNILKGNLRDFIKHSVWLVIYLQNFTKYFDWLYVHHSRPEGSKEDLYKFVGGQCLKYFLQIEFNAQGIRNACVNFNPKYFLEIKVDTEAYGIFLSSSMLNHSCLPNAIQSFHGTKSIISASEDIKKGTEITINYLAGTPNVILETEPRRKELRKFYFSCSCRKCVDPNFDASRNPLLCPRCGGKAFPQSPLIAKCDECFNTFNILEYINRARTLVQMYKMVSPFLYTNRGLLLFDRIFQLLEKTYHKHSIQYVRYYKLNVVHYVQTGNIKRCVEIFKSLYETCRAIEDEDSNEKLAFLSFTYFSAKYCAFLKRQGSEEYNQCVNETKERIQKSVNMLQYVMGPDEIKDFIIYITKVMNSNFVETEKIDDGPLYIEDALRGLDLILSYFH